MRASIRNTVRSPARISPASTVQPESIPFDSDEAELEEYAAEYARITALAEFEDLPEEELFDWSDIEGLIEEDSMDLS